MMMGTIGKLLWLVPFAVQVGLIGVTISTLPEYVGRTFDNEGLPTGSFLMFWISTVLVANFVFLWLHVRLPTFGDRMLAVPGKEYWLAKPERKMELVGRLRGILAIALFGMNLFFLAVYQAIYQANVFPPIVQFSMPVLFVGFMVFPLLMILIVFVVAMRRIVLEADAKSGTNEDKVS